MPKTTEEQKEAGKTKKPLTKSQKEKVKEKVEKAATVRKSVRMIKQLSEVAFGTMAILDGGPHYTLFDKPDGAKTKGARGCKQAEVTLGPLAGWPPPEPGTDAEARYPDAIIDVRTDIDNATYAWKSGHVINANFGGYGKSNDNMTCLTSSANKSQQAFDNNVARARDFLHKVYSGLRRAGKGSDYFKALCYGIKVEIEMSDEAWGDTYPWNCVSTSMSLEASIVNEPAEDQIREDMEGRKESEIRQLLSDIASVSQYVAAANQCHTVDNMK